MSNILKISTPVQFVSASADPTGVAGLTYYNSTSGTMRIYVNGSWQDATSSSVLTSTLTNYAPLASPALTGTPTAPTATGGTNTTQIATTAFVTSAISSSLATAALDGTFVIENTSDTTKKIAFSAAGIATATTRTLTMPNANVDLGNLTNSNIAAAAAIAYSKLSLSGSIVNADIASAAAISYSKLATLGGSTNAVLTQSGSGFVQASSILSGNLFLADGSVSASASFNLGGFNITNLADPTTAQMAATKNYVDNAVAGLSWKTAVRAASALSNITISSAPATIDGVSLSSGDRVLLKDQSTGSQNGVYIFNGTGSPLTRATDMVTWGEVVGSVMLVVEGTVNVGTKWVNTNVTGGTIGTTAITFTTFSISGAVNGSGTANYVAYWSGTSNLTAEQYLASSRGGLGANASAFTGVVKASSGVFSAATIVDADISSSAAITLSKLAALSNNFALVSNGSGVISVSSVTSTTLSYLDATSSIQTQLNGKANTALSNLSTTSIGTSLLPSADATYNLGSPTLSWSLGYIDTIWSVAALGLNAKVGSNGNVNINADGTGTVDVVAAKLRLAGAGSSNFMEESYVDSITLNANVTSATAIAALGFSSSSFKSAIIDYTITEATTLNQRTGRLMVATDGTVTAAEEVFGETNALGNATGLSLGASISAGTVSITYNNTNTSNAATMRAKVTRFRA